MLPTQSIIDQINTHHTNAMKQASDAVESAIAAGKILLEAKSNVPHGTWKEWLKTHIYVSERQAQRYMAAAKGKKVNILELAGKNDMMSDLAGRIFVPLPRHMYFAKDVGSIDNHYLVESCSEHPDFFFVTHIIIKGNDQDTSQDEMTARPVEALAVHENLIYFGMTDPLEAKWLKKRINGVMEAGESIYGPSENPPKYVVPRLSPRPINIETGEIDWDYYDRDYEHTGEFKQLIELESKNNKTDSISKSG
jgi:hypothetical protein